MSHSLLALTCHHVPTGKKHTDRLLLVAVANYGLVWLTWDYKGFYRLLLGVAYFYEFFFYKTIPFNRLIVLYGDIERLVRANNNA